METNFKVGDKVRIRKDLKVGERYGGDIFVENMVCMLGKKATIDSININIPSNPNIEAKLANIKSVCPSGKYNNILLIPLPK